MKLLDSMVLWNDGDHADIGYAPLSVRVVDYSRGQDFRGYFYSDGACYADWRQVSPERRYLWLMELFHSFVVKFGLSPARVHEEFVKIDEYQDRCGGGIIDAVDLLAREF